MQGFDLKKGTFMRDLSLAFLPFKNLGLFFAFGLNVGLNLGLSSGALAQGPAADPKAAASAPMTVATKSNPAIIASKKETASKVIVRHAALVHETYADLLASVQTLRKNIDALALKPSAATHKATKDSWIASRKVYGLTESFRFYGGPIDDPKSGPEGLMNAWPLDESYVDAVKDAPESGYINNLKLFPEITKEVLLSLNEKDGEKNISTGYHALEFLLWGQDINPKGAGNRLHSAYVDDGKNNAQRRLKAMKLLAEILEEHARTLEAAWLPGVADNYAATFVALPQEEAVQKILSGIAVLSIDEMAGERMTVALAKSDQENEQSCFSDTTTNDFVANAQGIRNVWTGRYVKMSNGNGNGNGAVGPGLETLVAAVNPALARDIDKALKKSLVQLKKIPTPFDRVLVSSKNSPGRKVAEAAVTSLEAQAKLLARAAHALGVEINVQE